MPLITLNITHFRNISSATLHPLVKGFNFLYGLNGSGKTSLLESIHYLGLGRSFKSVQADRIIHYEADKFSLFTEALISRDSAIPIGISRSQKGAIKIRINGNDAQSLAELAELTPIQLINSHCHELLESAPLYRRKYMDWGAFYGSSSFLKSWRDFGRVLKQRNAALRSPLSKAELSSWTNKLIECAIHLDNSRKNYINQLLPLLKNTLSTLLPVFNCSIDYFSGWDTTSSYADVLARSIESDLYRGHTQQGPHKADLKVTIRGLPAKDILSRGQQKLFVCAMIIARGTLLQQDMHRGLIYLVDDLPSELDTVSRANLMTLLAKQNAQIFVTAVERESLDEMLMGFPHKMFHVEHGCIKEI